MITVLCADCLTQTLSMCFGATARWVGLGGWGYRVLRLISSMSIMNCCNLVSLSPCSHPLLSCPFLFPLLHLSPPASLLLQDFAVPGLCVGCIICPGMAVPRAARQILYYYATSSLAKVGVAGGCGRWVWLSICLTCVHVVTHSSLSALCRGRQHLMATLVRDTGGCGVRCRCGGRHTTTLGRVKGYC